MSKNEQIDFEREVEGIVPCTCIDAYKLRRLSAPDCPACNFNSDITELISDIARRVEEQTIQRCYRILMTEKGGIERLYATPEGAK